MEPAVTKIDEKFTTLGGAPTFGAPLGPEEDTYDGGSERRYANGSIYFHPRHGEAFAVTGAIRTEYDALFDLQSALGYPIADEAGQVSRFEFGTLTNSGGTVTTTIAAAAPVAPQIIVKVLDGVAVDLAFGAELSIVELARRAGAEGVILVDAAEKYLPGLTLQRLWTGTTPEDLAALVSQAIDLENDYSPPWFENFLQVECPPELEDPYGLADVLASFTLLVEYAYVMPGISDPVNSADDPLFSQQDYAGTGGINAPAAWAKGSTGSGNEFIDLEQGWFLSHEDLPRPGGKTIRLIHGISKPTSKTHGTAVIGEVVGSDNTVGIVGGAPDVSIRLVSHFTNTFRDATILRHNIQAALMVAGTALIPKKQPDDSYGQGGVLLIEAQLEVDQGGTSFLAPVETDPVIFAIIWLMSVAGVTVVEAGANGALDLDTYESTSNTFLWNKGAKVLNRSDPAFLDSRAIMVGAATSASPHTRPSFSNHGSRIDCFALSDDHLVTAYWDPARPKVINAYFSTAAGFGGTSGASPVIAAACILLQGLHARLVPLVGSPGVLWPRRAREILSTAANGSTTPDPIGVMPDFIKIIANEYQP